MEPLVVEHQQERAERKGNPKLSLVYLVCEGSEVGSCVIMLTSLQKKAAFVSSISLVTSSCTDIVRQKSNKAYRPRQRLRWL